MPAPVGRRARKERKKERKKESKIRKDRKA
jgi:hypothetical protein